MSHVRELAKRFVRFLHVEGPVRENLTLLRELAPASRRERQRLADFYRRLLSPGDLGFDVGANVGNRTCAFLDAGAKVVSIEPQTGCARILKRRFRSNPRFELVEAAVGAEEGNQLLHVGEVSNISTLSSDWMSQTQDSGRWSESTWSHAVNVPVTTLDRLIERYGRPAFCKIDVEGYEPAVLEGLTTPIDQLSFEFTLPECVEDVRACVDRLSSLADYRYNYSFSETLVFESPEWLSAPALLQRIEKIRDSAWGDIYARRTGSA
jgi:FkbM family methyltransferase